MHKTMVLCAARHEMPENDEAIFGTEVDPLDISALDRIAEERVEGLAELTLYVTGLSVALVAVINACHKYNVVLTLMHYDRSSGC